MTVTSTHKEIESVLALVSPRVGIIRRLRRLGGGVTDPTPPFLYEAVLADFDFTREGKTPRAGVGKGEAEYQAIQGAIGEAVERYCAWQPDYDSVLTASYAELGSRAISPRELVLYTEEQYERGEISYQRFDERAPISWIRARTLPDGHEIFVPASQAYLGYGSGLQHDYMCQNTSNGLAAGRSVEAAVLSGLYELIERDGFLITWMNRLSAPRVDFSELQGLAYHIRTHYQRFGIELHVFNVTTDIPIYVMTGIAIDHSASGPKALVGLGCNLNPTTALLHALMEVCQVRRGEVWRYQHDRLQDTIRTAMDVRELRDHSALFARPEMIEELRFLLETSRSQRIGDLSNLSRGDVNADLTRCVDELIKIGCRVAYADLTTFDVVPFGYQVVRTFATGLQPIHFGYLQERLGGRRLYKVPRALGYSVRARHVDDLNRCPHPLP